MKFNILYFYCLANITFFCHASFEFPVENIRKPNDTSCLFHDSYYAKRSISNTEAYNGKSIDENIKDYLKLTKPQAKEYKPARRCATINDKIASNSTLMRLSQDRDCSQLQNLLEQN